MTDLATLAEVKKALRIDHSDDDVFLRIAISAASKKVRKYIAPVELLPYLETDGEIDTSEMPSEWKTATILLVGYFNRNRDADPDGDFTNRRLPGPVESMLSDYHDPALA